MQVLKIHTTTITSSFRLPLVHVGNLPTHDMPPPATIYGHICGAMGDYLTDGERKNLEFAYIFTYKAKAEDVETLHSTEIATGTMDVNGEKHKKSVNITTNVQRRQFLYDCDMKLYLKSDDTDLLKRLQDAFLSPYWAYVLGRSQDLATCHSAKMIDIVEERDNLYMHHSLVPFDWRGHITAGEPVMMTKSLDYDNYRHPSFERYLQLLRRPLLIYEKNQGENGSNDLKNGINTIPDTIYADPSDMKWINGKELTRGLYFHKLG